MAFSSNLTLAVPDLRAIHVNRTDAAVTAFYGSSLSWKFTAKAVSAHRLSTSRSVISPEAYDDRKFKYSLNAPDRSIYESRRMRWWEKSVTPNMLEIGNAQNLFDSLLNAGDNLVIVDFYSPGCGGCRALHPKISQLAESNPDTVFLRVNYDELRTLCHLLRIHVLPFFKFYRGADGCLCSFSCTNSTIKKFKDALAKHSTDRCTVGPVKGLDESVVFNLASSGVISAHLHRDVGEFLLHCSCRGDSFLNKALDSRFVKTEKN